MVVFKKVRDPGVKPKFSLAIDPGVASAGFCLLSPPTNDLEYWAIQDPNTKVTQFAFPELRELIAAKAKQYIDRVPLTDIQWKDTEIVIEYPFLGGQFSVGLMLTANEIVGRLWDQKSVCAVTFIPARIPEFFAKTRSVSDTETKILAGMISPKWDSTKRTPVHAADAFLFSVFRHYNYYKSVGWLNANVREPTYTVKQIPLSWPLTTLS